MVKDPISGEFMQYCDYVKVRNQRIAEDVCKRIMKSCIRESKDEAYKQRRF